MADDSLLCKVKTCLRVTTAAFDDDEISPLIDACIEDLKGAGVDTDKNKNLVERAIVFYCKGHFGLAPSNEWINIYERLRNALASRTAVTSDEF